MALALAGIAQALEQVEHIAKTGYVKTAELDVAINSLFATDPESTLAVYGNSPRNLLCGLELLQNLLTNYRNSRYSDLLRYLVGILHIQKKLRGKKDLLKIIGVRLAQAELQTQHFHPSHDNVIRNIAGIYTDTISKFQYRIQVTGNYNYLQQDRVANQIRTLLLAAIRSATLWRQLGGTRWHFLFYRKELRDATDELLKEAKHAQLLH